MTTLPVRGQIYRVDIGEHGPKPYVVVSNNQRNRRLDTVLAVRVTTTDKSKIPTAVPLSGLDPLVGYALADDITEIWKDELEQGTYLGALSPKTVLKLNDALAQALGIP
ncbi:type II toxin-antitoxin system PemK/MazF family toxin [Amycolatopsis sp. NPDC004079]|uniref:type II toxin-antitoxin system PemK/MazF family toxin n=1 Tax=Amycolatopsis sp. NPDC004079 TaxID=3154549 RepID=UPI0033A26A24